jgi:DNA topoisomerase II
MIRAVSEVDHVLLRPGMYTGAECKMRQVSDWEYTDKCEFLTRDTNLVLKKCVDEILSNAIDNCASKENATLISVCINDTSISVINDGVDMKCSHMTGSIKSVHAAFGMLRTSSHFDSGNQTIGTNGLGVKLANIFSTKFEVQLVDSDGEEVTYVWKNNMREMCCDEAADPELSAGCIKVTMYPDMKTLKCSIQLSSYIGWVRHRLLEAGTESGLELIVNGEVVPNVSELDFARLHCHEDEVVTLCNGVVACMLSEPMDSLASCISVVNGGRTIEHGIHVDAVRSMIHASLSCKKMTTGVFSRILSENVFLFIKTPVRNPVFSSQSKCKLVGGELTMRRILKTAQGFLDQLQERVQMEMMLKQTPRQQRKGAIRVEKLHDAIEAGSKNSLKCTLILTEGDSAKTFAMSGLGVVGHDFYGVFPLRGKALNVRDEDEKKILANAEWKNVLTILGLTLGTSHFSSLRYGRVTILSDADLDGAHIAGLIMNFFDSQFPSLLRNIPNFLSIFRTPVVKCSNGLEFFSVEEFNDAKVPPSVNCMYLKGLGSSTREEAKSYFRRHAELTKPIGWCSPQDWQMMSSMFSKKKSHERKQLIEDHINTPASMTVEATISAHDFCKIFLLRFSAMNIRRSIASCIDGMKVSQRKILWVSKTLKHIKVAQLASTVALKTQYLHGEQSLCECIIGMAQDFVGSNNMPVFTGHGQFGSRLLGGKDAASPRYIHVSAAKWLAHCFMPVDDDLLDMNTEENTTVEPVHMIPVVPMVLINGTSGIATGWSSFVPPHNPKDVIECVRCLIDKRPMPHIRPCWNKFRGRVTSDDQKCTTRGRYSVTGGKAVVEELPVYVWTETFKAKIESMKEVSKVRSRCDDENVHLEFSIQDSSSLDKLMSTTLSLANMWLLDENQKLRKFESAREIIEHHHAVRLGFYVKRKGKLIGDLRAAQLRCEQLIRFIELIREQGIAQFMKDPEQFLVANDLPPSLLKVTAKEMSEAKLSQLYNHRDAILAQLKETKDMTVEDMYRADLDVFEKSIFI